MPANSTRIRLQPANTSRIPFWGQIFIGTIWIVYTLALIFTDSGLNDMHFLHYVFLIFSVVYLGYVLVHNAPVFGTQSYLEFTPGYIVHKAGLFRPKQVFAAESITRLEMAPRQVRVHTKDDGTYALSLREVRGRKRKRQLMEQLRTFAIKYQIPLVDAQAPA
ncbi:hypothetical protein KBK19_06875 [Microvirga sp. STR05]|uniref:Uncharacterized protein n=2 Tax=Hymenobacter TaxID=89966 RepID=A0A7G7WA11_9BACT|nr:MULTISPECIES: hypothetical protein [Hymenobacter]MBD2714751.1 hypothetical protein [Hymenobacter duratus]MBR7949656.1 hypothetical protein [Microvirga sp. STR05]QNH63204.1 hypothetical protein H4317_05185 [Hymenobacter sediminicola]